MIRLHVLSTLPCFHATLTDLTPVILFLTDLTPELLFRLLRTSMTTMSDAVRNLVELLVAKVQVPLPLYAVWCEVHGFGTGGRNVENLIEEKAKELGVFEIVRGVMPTTYCAELAKLMTCEENEYNEFAATTASFMTQKSEKFLVASPPPSPSRRRVASPRKVGGTLFRSEFVFYFVGLLLPRSQLCINSSVLSFLGFLASQAYPRHALLTSSYFNT